MCTQGAGCTLNFEQCDQKDFVDSQISKSGSPWITRILDIFLLVRNGQGCVQGKNDGTFLFTFFLASKVYIFQNADNREAYFNNSNMIFLNPEFLL